MDLKLRFDFNDHLFQGFTILNPPTVPMQGEMISIRWEDFMTNQDDIKSLYEIEENSSFMADILVRTYTKDYVEVLIILFEENAYHRHEAWLNSMRKRHTCEKR